jgi:hypothetical protein
MIETFRYSFGADDKLEAVINAETQQTESEKREALRSGDQSRDTEAETEGAQRVEGASAAAAGAVTPPLPPLKEGGKASGEATPPPAPLKEGGESQSLKEGGESQSLGEGGESQSLKEGGKDSGAVAKYYELLKDPEVKSAQQRTIDRAFDSRYYKIVTPLKEQLSKQENLLEKLHAIFGTADIASLEAAIDKADELYDRKADEHGMSSATYRAYLENERLARRYRLEEETRRKAETEQAQLNERMSRETAEFEEQFPGVDIVPEIRRYGDLNSPDNEFMNLIKSGMSIVNAYKILSFGGTPPGAAGTPPLPPLREGGESQSLREGGRSSGVVTRTEEGGKPQGARRPDEGAAGSGGQQTTARKLTKEDEQRQARWG